MSSHARTMARCVDQSAQTASAQPRTPESWAARSSTAGRSRRVKVARELGGASQGNAGLPASQAGIRATASSIGSPRSRTTPEDHQVNAHGLGLATTLLPRMLDGIGVDRQTAGTWDAERELSGAELPERRPARRGPTEVRGTGPSISGSRAPQSGHGVTSPFIHRSYGARRPTTRVGERASDPVGKRRWGVRLPRGGSYRTAS